MHLTMFGTFNCRSQNCRAGRHPSLAIAYVLALVLAAAPIRCATDSSVSAAASRTGEIDLSLVAGLASVPLRVDYRDRGDAFDLDLLGAATGMCSLSGDCNACSHRDANPCQVLDRYGADPSLCQLPSFLGGAVASDSLCGIGATVEVTITTPPGESGSSSSSDSGSVAVATLTAFRIHGGKLVLTVTARCGWVLLPSEGTALNQSNSGDGGGAQPPLVIVEGDLNYLGSDLYFAAPAEEAAAGETERYSCYSTELKLRGLSSRCQALNLDLELRFAVQRLDVVAGGGGSGGGATGSGPMCREAGPVLGAVAHLKMRVPQARAARVAAAAAAAALASTTTTTASTASAGQATARQQLFSNGVAATSSYTASVDPRDSETTAWLQSLTSQYPVVSVKPSSTILSFLVGSVRRELQSGLAEGAAAVAGSSSSSNGEAPLLPAGLYLESCGRQSISAVVAAVVSALAGKGVTDKYVSDVVCLQSPYKQVPVSELPPCAPYTLVLFNVTLEVPLSGATGVTSSILNTLTSSSGSSLSGSISNSAAASSSTSGATDPQVLADVLVGAQLAAPWACLSTERQMRMATQLELELQLPKGPGVEAVDASDRQTSASAPTPSPTSKSTSPEAASGSADTPAGLTNPPGPRSSSPGVSDRSFGTAATAAVAVAVALALTVAVVAFFAIRSARKSKEAARSAAAAAMAAAATAAGGGYASGAPGSGKVLPPPPPLSSLKQQAAALEAEPSYASTCDYGRDSASAAAWSAAAASPQQQPTGGGGVVRRGAGSGNIDSGVTPPEGVVPWTSMTAGVGPIGGAGGLAPAVSAASLEPFAAAVEAAAAAASAAAVTGAAARRVPSSSGSSATAVVTAADVAAEECEDQPLSSVRGTRVSPASSPPTAVLPRPPTRAGATAAPSAPAPARVLPITPPPPAFGGGSSPSSARAPVSPLGQPAPRRRGRTLRVSGANSGSVVSEASSEGVGAAGYAGGGGGASAAGVATPGGATTWSNALYDAPQQMYDIGGEGGDGLVASGMSAI